MITHRTHLLTAVGGLALLITTGCAVHHRVWPVDASTEPSRDGVVYSLPSTHMTITLPVTQIAKKTGAFFTTADPVSPPAPARPYADQLEDILKNLRALEIITNAKTEKHLRAMTYDERTVKVGTASVSTAPVWNDQALFLIEWPSSATEARTLSASLDEAGFLTDSSSAARDQTLDVTVKVIDLAASVAGKVVGFGSATITTLDGQQSDLTGRYALAAGRLERIKTIRTNIAELIGPRNAGDARIDNPSLDHRIALLRKEEAALKQYFIKTTTRTWSAAFGFTPDDTSTGLPIELLDIFLESRPEGKQMWIAKSPQAGGVRTRPVLLGTIPTEIGCLPSAGTPATRTSTTHQVEIASLRSFGWSTQHTSTRNSSLGYRYRVPGQALVDHFIRTNSTNARSHKKRWDVMIAQFGPIRALPSTVGTGDSTVTIVLHRDLGSLKSVKAVSKVTAAGQIETVRGALETTLDTIAASSDDARELVGLQAENAILEARKKNAELKAALADE